MKKSQLKKYAKLVVKMGANVRKGQPVVINAGLDQPEFVTMVVEQAYKAGASRVTVDWAHQPLTRLNVTYMTDEELAKMPEWAISRMKHYAETLPAMIHIMSADPDGLKGIDQKKMSAAQRKTFPIIKPIRDSMENKYQWTIIAVPGKAWARKVFPNLSPKKAVAALWDAILQCTRVTANPIKAWKDHNADIKVRYDYLNALHLDHLHITTKEGSDFTVGLIPEAEWLGGGETTTRGVFFNPNMPTEEVFITPDKRRTSGKIVATMPLSFKGEVIDNFSLEFKDGKVTDIHGPDNAIALLKELVAMDEGSSMLGEVALVPFESPIRQSGVLFYNTLFDENAACHVALGRGFSNLIKGFDKLTQADFKAMGVNESMMHVDFMIGSRSTNIVGFTKDGKKIQIFKDGNWAF